MLRPVPMPIARTDEDLVNAFDAGDTDAFKALFSRHRDPILSYAWRMLRRREEAEEVCVEVFSRVIEGRYRPTGSLRSFLFTVTHRLCLDRLRRRNRWDRVRSLLGVRSDEPSSPEAAAIKDQRATRLEAAIGTLPDKHRAAILLTYGQELPGPEVARILGMTNQQLRSALSYARRRLRAELTPAEEVSP